MASRLVAKTFDLLKYSILELVNKIAIFFDLLKISSFDLDKKTTFDLVTKVAKRFDLAKFNLSIQLVTKVAKICENKSFDLVIKVAKTCEIRSTIAMMRAKVYFYLMLMK